MRDELAGLRISGLSRLIALGFLLLPLFLLSFSVLFLARSLAPFTALATFSGLSLGFRSRTLTCTGLAPPSWGLLLACPLAAGPGLLGLAALDRVLSAVLRRLLCALSVLPLLSAAPRLLGLSLPSRLVANCSLIALCLWRLSAPGLGLLSLCGRLPLLLGVLSSRRALPVVGGLAPLALWGLALLGLGRLLGRLAVLSALRTLALWGLSGPLLMRALTVLPGWLPLSAPLPVLLALALLAVILGLVLVALTLGLPLLLPILVGTLLSVLALISSGLLVLLSVSAL